MRPEHSPVGAPTHPLGRGLLRQQPGSGEAVSPSEEFHDDIAF